VAAFLKERYSPEGWVVTLPVKDNSFDWCKRIRRLPFDIVMTNAKYPSVKLIVEVDGDHHFIDVPAWRSVPAKVRTTDVFKMQKALLNGYFVVRIVQDEVWDEVTSGTSGWKTNLETVVDAILYGGKGPHVVYVAKRGDIYDAHRTQMEAG
jgi:very-short-patch-repair endonuclease